MFDPTTRVVLKDNTTKLMKDLTPGELVLDNQGQGRKVLEVLHSKGDRPRFKLETVDFRTIVACDVQTWETHSIQANVQVNPDGEQTPRLYTTLELPVKPRGLGRTNLARFMITAQEPNVVGLDSDKAVPELRAIAETMGQPEFLDVTGTWKKKVNTLLETAGLEKLTRADEPFWFRFKPNFDYEPFTIHPEVLLSTTDYRERYLSAVFYLCGEFRSHSLAYVAHARPDYVAHLRTLVRSMGGITPHANHPLKIMIQKSVNRLGFDYTYMRLQTRGVNNYVPGNYFRPNSRFTLGLHSREELAPGPVVGLLLEGEQTHCLTDEYFPLYLPTW